MSVAIQRITMRKQFESILDKNTEWITLAAETRETIVRRIERSCFEVTINTCIRDGIDRLFTEKKFVDRYSTNCYRILSNMNIFSSVGSKYLLEKVISGEIDPYTIASLTPKDLCPEAHKQERDEIALRQTVKFENKVSRAYICRKCKGNETIPIEYQARSADEASSRSIKCVNCEFVWRT